MKVANVYCPYCGKKAELVDSVEIYSKSYGMIWMCFSCDAYTGVHKSSKSFQPLGTLANQELRGLRQRTHHLFDPMWRDGKMSRTEAYDWLARKMNIDKKKCHVAMFSKQQCKQAIETLTPLF